uniref:Uncharacterized protein n=1 Tax=Mycobacterium riyadhense TaxID=486698 RepID=A0A653ERW2_9MYCO|nr:hypothetical protein BIN_B_03314 [Mycobacterium riyadhense]
MHPCRKAVEDRDGAAIQARFDRIQRVAVVLAQEFVHAKAG